MKFARVILLLVVVGSLCITDTADAWRYRKSRKVHRFGGARPVTGYGANIHRNFILKQEARRARQGQRVRNRGNILWYR